MNMKELLDKLTSYNLFNYLLPGVIFAALLTALTSLKIIQSDIVVGVFVYYFLGLIVSRIGSLIIEPLLKKSGFLKFAPYVDFLDASKNDPKIEILSESNNMYRTFCAVFVLVGFVKIYDCLSGYLPILAALAPYILLISLSILFLVAYKKQTNYITQRVAAKKS